MSSAVSSDIRNTLAPNCGNGIVTGSGPALKAQYKVNDGSATDNQIKPGLRVVNTGSTRLALSDITLRYWYTADGAQSQRYSCDYAVVGCSNITGTFGTPAYPASTADRYLEIGFKSTAGSLAPGASSGEIQSRINKSDWSSYNEANDYSYGASQTSFADWSKVTVYYKGALVWGTEPEFVAPHSDLVFSEDANQPRVMPDGRLISTVHTAKYQRALGPRGCFHAPHLGNDQASRERVELYLMEMAVHNRGVLGYIYSYDFEPHKNDPRPRTIQFVRQHEHTFTDNTTVADIAVLRSRHG